MDGQRAPERDDAEAEDRLGPFREIFALQRARQERAEPAKAFLLSESFAALAEGPITVGDAPEAIARRRAESDHRISMLRALKTVLEEERARILAVHPGASASSAA